MLTSTISLSLFLFSMTKALYTCASPIDFDKFNPALKNSLSEEMKLENETGTALHNVMFKYSKPVGAGSYGEVREYNFGDVELVIKKISHKNSKRIPMMQKEVELLKLICGLKAEVVYNKLRVCKSKAIAEFYGCVEDGFDLFIFEEKMDMSVESEEALLIYNNLRGQQKADIMLQIISKFEEIHQKDIIHADIKPKNLMIRNNDLSDIRIIDFGLSNYKWENSRGGTRFFISPEQKNKKVLGFEGDIYSLAVTFASFEFSFTKFMNTKMDRVCFDPTKPPSISCITKFREGVIATFNKNNETEELAEVMKTALAEDPRQRFHSMKKFKSEILKVYHSLPSAIKPRIHKSEGIIGFLKQFFDFCDSSDISLDSDLYDSSDENSFGRILTSNSQHQNSRKFSNRILTDKISLPSKIII